MKLLTIRSEEENQKLYDFIIQNGGPREYWTSGSKMLNGKTWVWLAYGEIMNYEKFGSSNSDDNCLQVYPTNQQLYWRKAECNSYYYFVCERYDSQTLSQGIEKSKTTAWDNLLTDVLKVEYLNYEKKKYLLIEMKGTFIEAIQICKVINMQLISIPSKELNLRLTEYIRDYTRVHQLSMNEWWTSGSKLLDRTTWIWLTKGVAVSYTNWLNGQPSSIVELCLRLIYDNGGLYWNSHYCHKALGIICESLDDGDDDGSSNTVKNLVTTIPTTPTTESSQSATTHTTFSSSKPSIQDNVWENIISTTVPGNIMIKDHGGVKYHVEKQLKGTYARASRFCEYHNMQLVDIIDGTQSSNLAAVMAAEPSGDQYWVGATKISGIWTWSKSQPSTYTNWANGKPSTGNTKNCLQVDILGAWYDEDCDIPSYFICVAKTVPDNVASASNGQCSQPIVNVYVHTNMITGDDKESLITRFISSENVTSDEGSYHVKISNNIGVTDGKNASDSNKGGKA